MALRIVYFGTPEFAVPSLKILVDNGYEVAAVVTAPDKPGGRGRMLQESAVKQYAVKQGLKVLQPVKLRDPEFIETLRSLDARLFIVVAFRMMPEIVWSMPPEGTFNLHASLLPSYRGAAPINWAIINGEKETGVTTFFLKHAIDTGDLLLQEKEAILPDDDAGTLYVRLMHKGADLVLRTVQMIEENQVKPVPQLANEDLPEAPKIFREDCQIDWQQHAERVRNHVRGLSPYPGAWTELNGSFYKIFAVEITEKSLGPGEVKVDGEELYIGTADRAIKVIQLQAEGKRRMYVKDYLKGNTI